MLAEVGVKNLAARLAQRLPPGQARYVFSAFIERGDFQGAIHRKHSISQTFQDIFRRDITIFVIHNVRPH